MYRKVLCDSSDSRAYHTPRQIPASIGGIDRFYDLCMMYIDHDRSIGRGFRM